MFVGHERVLVREGRLHVREGVVGHERARVGAQQCLSHEGTASRIGIAEWNKKRAALPLPPSLRSLPLYCHNHVPW